MGEADDAGRREAGGIPANRQNCRPIRDYALIGDCHGSALVARDGRVDWCCLQRFDADPVFCRLLDETRGGFLEADVRGRTACSRRYLNGTNILRTEIESESGRIALTDFMPVGRRLGAGPHDYVSLNAPGWLVRLVSCEAGEVPVRIRYRPTPGFARRSSELSLRPGRIDCDGGVTLYHDLSFEIRDGVATSEAVLSAGESRHLAVTPSPLATGVESRRLERLLAITRAFWKEWIEYCRYDGPYREAVERSALALKLLTYAPSGAIVAAPTTSLPESLGGTRNWDYRFCWLRDSAFMLYALSALGYSGEARSFSRFLATCCQVRPHALQIMYGVGGETELTEQQLDHLAGYCGSRPVRVGNGAFEQRQIDIYGELLDWALLYRRLGGRLPRAARRFLGALAEAVCAEWREPDHGIWEMRGPRRHHVHGKVMSWVALDRAIALLGPRPDWTRLRQTLAEEIITRGCDPSGRHLVQAYGHDGTDAALLLLPMLGFPLDAELMSRTVTAIESELRHGDYVQRYRGDDGLEGQEGAFLICSFWLVDALLCLDRADEARQLFENLVACANDVGLYSEEIDSETGAFLGNFPQAFTHLALVGSAQHLALFERGGPAALRGSYADRAQRVVTATFGWRALWAAFRASGRVNRLFPSRRSVLSARDLS